MSSENTKNDLLRDVAELTGRFRTVLMATSSLDGEPEISYSPQVIVNGALYVFVSDLSLHTGNLKENPRASLLFIENEEDAENLHARRRVTYKASADLIAREDPQWATILDAMEGQFGELIGLLKSLTDFHLIKLQPESVNIVRGFADAHTFGLKEFVD